MTPLPTFKSRRRPQPRQGGGEGEDLVRRYFLLQDERPDGVEEIEIASLEPFLRGLLVTDGTVTRALGVQLLEPVAVSRLDQSEVPLPAAAAVHLETAAGEPSVRRRVRIGIGATAAIWAQSYILPERLPPGFLGLLDGAPDGIGQSLQRVALESYRELLWFGFTAAPEWTEAAPAGGRTIQRLYRIVSDRQAALLISECFAVEERHGLYRLAGTGAADATAGGERA
jgi:chorismate-pyruvate lyase